MIDLELMIQPTTKKSERRDAAENRQLVLAAASRLFATHGVESVCMSEIAKEAGVGKGTLYRRFASKGELCLALLDSELRQFQNDVIGAFQSQVRNGVSVCQRLNWFVEQAVSFTCSHLPLMVEISEVGSENTVQDINQPHFWMEMTVRGHLLQMQERGEIPADTDLDLDYIASAILAPLDARILKIHINQRHYSQAQISSGIQTIISGLCSSRNNL